MKRDMDMVRNLLLKIKTAPPRASWKQIITTDDNDEAASALWHLQLVEESGLIKSTPVHLQGYRLPENIELTWEGHDFLDSIRDPKIWEKTKNGAEAALAGSPSTC